MPSAQLPIFDYAFLTDPGGRSNNEDSVLAYVPPPESSDADWGAFFMVADGMGGTKGGDLASRIAIDTMMTVYYDGTDNTPIDQLDASLAHANSAVRSRAQQEGFPNMGTTAAGLLVLASGEAIPFSVGDCRVYRIRQGVPVQLTEDQSTRNRQLREGKVSVEELRDSKVTRYIGQPPPLEGYYRIRESWKPGDTYVVCSDGLWEFVSVEQMVNLVRNADAKKAATALIAAAKAAGTTDNVSAVVVHVDPSKRPKQTESSTRSLKMITRLFGLIAIALAILIAILIPSIGENDSGSIASNATDPHDIPIAFTDTLAATSTSTHTATLAPTDTLTATSTATPVSTDTLTATSTSMHTATSTSTGTSTTTSTPAHTSTSTPTHTASPTSTPTPSATNTPTSTATPTPVPPTSSVPEPRIDAANYPVIPEIPDALRDQLDAAFQFDGDRLVRLSFIRVGNEFAEDLLYKFNKEPITQTLREDHQLGELAALELFSGPETALIYAAASGWTLDELTNADNLADSEQCEPGETPLSCGVRIKKPTVAFILIGTYDLAAQDEQAFKQSLQNVLDLVREEGVILVLATIPPRRDDLELAEWVPVYNGVIVELAETNNVLLWNLWRALSALPDEGLAEDGISLSEEGAMVRDTTALSVLYAMYPYDAVVSNDDSRLREGPCTSYYPEDILSRGTRLKILKRTTSNFCEFDRWVLVEHDGQEGWVSVSVIDLLTDWDVIPDADLASIPPTPRSYPTSPTDERAATPTVPGESATESVVPPTEEIPVAASPEPSPEPSIGAEH